MRDATPPEPNPGSPQRLARTTAHTSPPPSAFVLSILSAIGVVIAAAVAPWPFIDPNLGFLYGTVVVLSAMVVLAGSLALAILSLVRSVPWRRAGGRSRQNVLSIALASFAILGVAVGVILFVFMLVEIVLVLGEI